MSVRSRSGRPSRSRRRPRIAGRGRGTARRSDSATVFRAAPDREREHHHSARPYGGADQVQRADAVSEARSIAPRMRLRHEHSLRHEQRVVPVGVGVLVRPPSLTRSASSSQIARRVSSTATRIMALTLVSDAQIEASRLSPASGRRAREAEREVHRGRCGRADQRRGRCGAPSSRCAARPCTPTGQRRASRS